ncbi:UNVERIFIED_CONTAM: D-aminoacyl-tRNA deacylase [Sesamum radiatum]|uniref:D-aminoacyl-tRNA deacylase n=1 Tax=Sesamum radiatum TaxID=300843 RepID=A0AAW2MXM5_SESRA
MTLVGLLARVSLIDFGHCRRTAATRFNRGYIANYRGKSTYTTSIREMVTLVVATTVDPASIGPASALLSMPGWQPGPSLQLSTCRGGAKICNLGCGISSFVNKEVRLLKHDRSIVREDHLDTRWEEATGEVVNEVIFLSRHTAVSNRPALTIHPIGVPHLQEGDVPPAGGKPGWAAPPNPRIGPWLRLLKSIAESHNLTPEFEITLEATHHGPETHSPTMFVEIGSTEEYWKRQDAAQAIALVGYPFNWNMSEEFVDPLCICCVIKACMGRTRAWGRNCSRKLEQERWTKQSSPWNWWWTLCTKAYGYCPKKWCLGRPPSFRIFIANGGSRSIKIPQRHARCVVGPGKKQSKFHLRQQKKLFQGRSSGSSGPQVSRASPIIDIYKRNLKNKSFITNLAKNMNNIGKSKTEQII